jgi:hypothetical protein
MRRWVQCALLLYSLLCTAVAQNSAWLEGQAAYQTCVASPATCTSADFFNEGLTGSLPSSVGLLTALVTMYVTLLLWVHALATGATPGHGR